MNKKNTVQGTRTGSLTISNTSRLPTTSSTLNANTAINFPTDEYVKKIIATGKEKVFLNEDLYIFIREEGIALVLKKGMKEEFIFSASEVSFNDDKTKMIYELMKEKLKPIGNLLKKRF